MNVLRISTENNELEFGFTRWAELIDFLTTAEIATLEKATYTIYRKEEE